MREKNSVQMMVTIPRVARDKLRRIAAEKNMKNLETVATAAGIVREVVCGYLDIQAEKGVIANIN